MFQQNRERKAEVFIPLMHRPGNEAQVDFFEVTVEVDGIKAQGVEVLDEADVLRARLRPAV